MAELCEECGGLVWGAVVVASKKSVLQADKIRCHECGGKLAFAGFIFGHKAWMVGFENGPPQRTTRGVGYVIYSTTTFKKAARGIALPDGELVIYEITPDELFGFAEALRNAVAGCKKTERYFWMYF